MHDGWNLGNVVCVNALILAAEAKQHGGKIALLLDHAILPDQNLQARQEVLDKYITSPSSGASRLFSTALMASGHGSAFTTILLALSPHSRSTLLSSLTPPDNPHGFTYLMFACRHIQDADDAVSLARIILNSIGHDEVNSQSGFHSDAICWRLHCTHVGV
eukprot:TRINITY_DN134_c0_g1::TRINITY_DN134_c0_g1_i1::g.14289::m.14289 TRINITY_DN134_c0_g1::TRINITY_DN134_c0_g1_i1::g.14289  ORF type:complete len:161 (+),score=27.96 TRINITY_DN134_c0_g1_i1:835-1317(+)